MVYPIDNYTGKNKADFFTWEFIDNNYKDEVFSFHNVQLNSTLIDCLLFCVGKGVIVLETKDYRAEEIKEVTSQQMIKFISRPVDYTGFPKVIYNREELIKIGQLDSIKSFVVGACNYPFISETDFEKTGLSKVLPRELVFLKDDWKDRSNLDLKISSLFEFIYKADEKVCCSLEKDKIARICSLINYQYGEAVKNYKYEEPKRFDIDLHANSSKELFYGICSFLMKNGITTGYICSKSKEILDGLGEYMTAVKIPWSYEGDGSGNIGYRFIDELPEKLSLPTGSVIISLLGKSSVQVTQGRHNSYNIEIHNRNKIYEKLHDIDIGTPIHLKNEQIREMFLKAFVVADTEIDIISPWMNFGVVNEYFVELLKSALERGVTIKIIYGLTPDSSEYNISRSNRSDQVAKYLLEKFHEYKNQLFITRDNIHYKLVLCDEKFKLEGGYNYLSFVGDYENKSTRKEGSPFGTQVDEIRFLRKEYFG